MAVIHPYWRTYDGNGSFRPLANTEPLGWAAHALAALIFGSYLAGWRSIQQPDLVVAVALGFSTIGLYLSAIGAFFNNDVFHTTVFGAIAGLWAGLALIYLVPSGILAAYTSDKTIPADTLDNGLGLYLLWWGVAFALVSFFALRRHIDIVAAAGFGSIALFLLSGSYLNATTSGASTAAATKAGGYFLLFSGIAAVIHTIAGVLAAEKHWVQLPVGPLRGDVHELHPPPLGSGPGFTSSKVGESGA